MESIFESWPWYVAGPIIGLFVPIFLLVGNKLFGISSSFDHICDLSFTKNISSKIKFNAEKDGWKILTIVLILQCFWGVKVVKLLYSLPQDVIAQLRS